MKEKKKKIREHPGLSLAIASEKSTIREKDSNGTFAAQPRTFAATSALPISTERSESIKAERTNGSDEKAPGIDIGRGAMTAVIKPRGGDPFHSDSPDRLAPALLANWRTWMRAKWANV